MKDFLIKAAKKIQKFAGENVDEKSNRIKIPFFSSIFGAFGAFVDKIKPFSVIAFIYCIVLSLLSFAFGFSYMCSYGQEYAAYCSDSNIAYFAYCLIKLVLIIMFVVKYHEFSFQSHPLSIKWLFSFGKKEAKVSAFWLALIISGLFPFISFYILYERIPNPDWVMEIIFFGLVSLGFLVPLFLMRLYSIQGFILEGEEVPSLKIIWERSKRNSMKIVFSVFLILLFAVLFLANFFANFRTAEPPITIYTGIVAEFLYNLVVMILVSIFVNNCLVQKTLLFRGEQKNG